LRLLIRHPPEIDFALRPIISRRRGFHKIVMKKCSIEESSISERDIFLVLRKIKKDKNVY